MRIAARATLSDRAIAHRFWWMWGLLLLARALLAFALPLFGDEAFYAWESRHLAWAYSDLPGATAWSIWLGRQLFENEFGVRLVALLLGALLPLQMLRIADAAGLRALRWQIGSLSLLLPLLSINGLLALPEPLLLMAAALCLHALLRLQTLGPNAPTALALPLLLELLCGLALGAFSHYRFLAVLGAGAIALLWVPAARALLRDVRLWIVVALGAAAWLPLLLFDLDGGSAGWRFQFVERHPWQFQSEALRVPLEQALIATPLAWLLMLAAIPAALRERQRAPGPALLAAAGVSLLLGLYLVGWFADRDRVSFHWPLVGQLALLPVLAIRLQQVGARLATTTWALLVAGSALTWALCLALASPQGRSELAQRMSLADNFSGAAEAQTAVREALTGLPAGTRVVADNFLLAAQLVQARGGDAGFGVMDHAANTRHGRARQLALWGMDEAGWIAQPDPARLLLVDETALGLRQQLPWQHALCERLPGLRALAEVQVNAGAKRLLLFAQEPGGRMECDFTALAYLDAPVDGERVARRFPVAGWAIQDRVGLDSVQVLIDGQALTQARIDIEAPGVSAQWPQSNDPRHPRVGIQADVEVPEALLGERVLGLRLTGADGRVRELPMARVRIDR